MSSASVEAQYEAKPQHYFANARADFVARLPADPAARVLEVGCGFGGTGRLALAEGKCGTYIGIDISPTALEQARPHLSAVWLGNIETMDLPAEPQSFDAIIMSEVLEHLVDPWATVRRLAGLLRPGGLFMASSPNIGHYLMVLALLRGRWELTKTGTMDETHLRWFTPASYRRMFEEAGLVIEEEGPIRPFSAKARLINALTGDRFRHLFMTQVKIVALKPSAP